MCDNQKDIPLSDDELKAWRMKIDEVLRPLNNTQHKLDILEALKQDLLYRYATWGN